MHFETISLCSKKHDLPNFLYRFSLRRLYISMEQVISPAPLVEAFPDQFIRPPIDQLKHVLDNEKSQNKSCHVHFAGTSDCL